MLKASFVGAAFVREDIYNNVLSWAAENGIKCVGSPFEADWQMVELERCGIVEGIYSVDSDLVTLGGKVVILKLKNTHKLTCQLAERAEVLKTLNMTGDLPVSLRVL